LNMTPSDPASYRSSQVTQPPPPIVTQVKGKVIVDHLKGEESKVGGVQGGERAQKEGKLESSSRMARDSSSASLRKSGGSKKSRSPSKRKSNKNDSPKFLQFTRKCTCNHAPGNKAPQSARLTDRDLPVHPLHDPGAKIKQLHQFSPNELEMIHTGRSCYVNEAEYSVSGGQLPEKPLLVYRGGTAAGSQIQSREIMRFPYNLPENYEPQYYPHSLSFDACFESGNLYQAVQIGPAEYDLFVRPDLHSAVGHNQWFYFAVANTHTKVQKKNKEDNPDASCLSRVKFNVINMLKNDSLFNFGMRPVMYSSQDSMSSPPVGWVRTGVPGTIGYYQNRWMRCVKYLRVIYRPPSIAPPNS
jgi:hypothetical protein